MQIVWLEQSQIGHYGKVSVPQLATFYLLKNQISLHFFSLFCATLIKDEKIKLTQ